jgi:hypothetical protein
MELVFHFDGDGKLTKQEITPSHPGRSWPEMPQVPSTSLEGLRSVACRPSTRAGDHAWVAVVACLGVVNLEKRV